MTLYKNILAIGAHPDDIELGCSGTLKKFMAQGAHVDIVIARDDNAPKPSVQRSRETTLSEYQASQEMLEIEFVFMNNPLTDDGRPILEWNNTNIEQMDRLIARKDYDLIITHSPGDHHNDHVNTYRIVNSSLRRYQGEFWLMECCPYANKNQQFTPTVFVDISDYIEDKINLVACYGSYFNDTLLHNIKNLAGYRGQMLNVDYAEAFELRWKTIK
jgi:LmbE family N-acetylglucosaminyl deacetylase